MRVELGQERRSEETGKRTTYQASVILAVD